jgi:hypothetical protein
MSMFFLFLGQWYYLAEAQRGFVLRSFRAFLLLFFVWILIVWSLVPPVVNKPNDDGSAGRVFTLVSTVTYENRNSQGDAWVLSDDDKVVGMFMNNSWQTVYLMNASCPLERFEADDDSNLVAYVDFPMTELEPHENVTYQICYRIVLKPRVLSPIFVNVSGSLMDVPEGLKAVYCSPGFWQSNLSLMRDLAYSVAGNETNVLSILSDYILWITRNIEYGSFETPRFPNETLLGRTGDCDDQANLLIGLCRAVGIPAFLQIGCIYMPERSSTSNYWEGLWTSSLTDIGWHGWAMVYVPPWGWLPVDLTYSRGNSSDPLSHISSSAIITDPTVQYMNITVSNYVVESRQFKQIVVSGMHRIITSDVLVEEVQDEEIESNMSVFPRFSVFLLALSCAACVVVPFFVFFRRVRVWERVNAY